MNDARLLSAKQHYETAAALHRQNRLAEAAQSYLAVHKLYPDHPGALHGLGLIGLRNNQPEDAAKYLFKASKLAPANPAIGCDLGQAYLTLGRYEDALTRFQIVLTAHPANTTALMGAGDALGILGRTGEARSAFEQLLAIDPNNAAAHFGLGGVMTQMGQAADARRAFERAVRLAPQGAAYHRALAETERFVENDPRLAALEALAQEPLANDQKVELHFALAKAYDDLKRTDDAFAQLRQGNGLQRKRIPYDEGVVAEFFDALTTAFTPAKMQRRTGAPSALPIFVVGMPRSGTTLVEQILASDPDVFGAGELTIVPDLIADGEKNYPRGELSDHALRRFGREYVKKLEALAPGAKHITDKLPANFRHIGLIHLALPNAKIVHVKRNPMDTCFSCYSKIFLNGLNYTYDLSELGHYHRMYETLMAHWRAVLPDGAMLEVQYETLVGDFTAEARRIVEYCGLEWSERFLAFHRNERAVRTHSQSQVRQPLFTSSIGRWRLYEKWLRPLRDALDQ
jgi:tetratricopeptide (TPR) repeat protein